MTIDEWLKRASNELADAVIPSARLDAELILAHTVGHPRPWLHAHGDDEIDERHIEIANARIDLRLDRVPIAYILGHKWFYGRRFEVNTHTLIPRPESEQLIELLNKLFIQSSLLKQAIRVVDVGTGSGCLGITTKLEHPELDVTLVDTSKQALAVAEKNAQALGANVTLLESNLLINYPFTPDIVLANLPYVDQTWQRSDETNYEPPEALFADHHGLALIERCFDECSYRMKSGHLILEADPRQWANIVKVAAKYGFQKVEQTEFAALFARNAS